jgi:hypothetical protein
MKVALIAAAVVGLCAVVEAGSIGFGSLIINRSASYQAQLQPSGKELMPAELDYPIYSIPPALLDPEPTASSQSGQRQQPSEPPPALIVASGLGFIVLAGLLRSVPVGLRRLNAMRLERERRHAHKRRVKVELRMMA